MVGGIVDAGAVDPNVALSRTVTPVRLLPAAVTFITVCSWDAAAQQATGTPVPGTAGQTSAASGDTSNNRLFGVLPNFLTVENAGSVPPLTAAQKFELTARGSFDWAEFGWYGALAGIGQLEHSDAGQGEGAAGYGRRYAMAFADGTIENFATKAIFPSLLHQDPRYFQLGKGGIGHRTWYAVSRIFITRSDSGHPAFNYSEVVGSGVAAGISAYTYHPANDRNLATVGSVWGTQMGYDALSFLAKEFWPDVSRKFHKSKSELPAGSHKKQQRIRVGINGSATPVPIQTDDAR
jgi:hypothetical protein